MSNETVVVVVGCGLAGACASIEAARAGAKVLLLEKEAKLGGNSAKATSGINGVSTSAQGSKGVDDVYGNLIEDTISSGGGKSNTNLVEILVKQSTDAVAFLESFGLRLQALSQCGGHSRPRTHRIPPGDGGKPVPVGFMTMKTLTDHIEQNESERITVVKEATVTRLITEEFDGVDGVVGVEYLKKGHDASIEVRAHAVILTTGGYGFAKGPDSLLAEFAPEKLEFATTNGPHASGEGVRLGRTIGADLVDMDQVQVHPTGLVKPSDPTNPVKFLAPEAMRGCGGILLNQHGRRFCNELGRRDFVTGEILSHCAPFHVLPPAPPGGGDAMDEKEQEESVTGPTSAYLVMNPTVSNDFGAAVLGFYGKMGLVQKATGAAGLAALIGCDEAAVTETLVAYTQAATGETEDAFGKTTFPAKDFAPDQEFNVAIVTPCIHYCMGGLRMNEGAEVLRPAGDGRYAAIPGLFGAGEVTGGVHGANRLAGNSLLECVVYGRIAGQRAAASNIDTALPPVCPDRYTPLKLRCKQLRGDRFGFTFELPCPRHTLARGGPGEPAVAQRKYSVRAELPGGKVVSGEVTPEEGEREGPPREPGVLRFEVPADGGAEAAELCNYLIQELPAGASVEFMGPLEPVAAATTGSKRER